MKIYRLTQQAIKDDALNKSYTFSSLAKTVDMVDMNDSLLTNLIIKESNREDLFSTSDLIRVDFEDNKEVIDNKITFDNEVYEFYLATASDLKKSSCLFVKSSRKNVYENFIKYATGDIKTKLEGKLVTVNKISSYIGLITSGATRIEGLKPKVVIIEEPKFLYEGYHTILKDLDTLEFTEENISTELVFSDGQGIVDSKFMEKVRLAINKAKNKDIKNMSWFSFRLYSGLGAKGMNVSVDIPTQLDRVHKKYGDTEYLFKKDNELYIKDVFGEYHKVSEVNMILNESQTKFSKYYKSNDEIQNAINNIPEEYKDIITDLYICNHSENKLSTSKMNYQFLQNLTLTYEEMLELTKVERKNLEQALTNKDALYLLCDLYSDDDEKDANEGFDTSLYLCKYNKDFLQSRAVADSIKKLIRSKINLINYSRVKIPNMNYKLSVHDPQVYLNFISQRNMEKSRDSECLQYEEIYVLGEEHGAKIVAGRNPLSSSQELLKFENTKNKFIDSLGYKTKDMVIFDSYSATPSRLSGMDFDGDTVGVIANNEMIYNSVIEHDTLFFNHLDGAKAEHIYNEENVKLMTKKCSSNFIGALAMLNAGVLNMINEVLFYDTRSNKYYTYDEIMEVLSSEVVQMDIPEGTNIYHFRTNYFNELLSSRVILNGIHEMSKEKYKEHIKSRHLKFKNLQYLILIVQQQAIDYSKTGIPMNENILKEINKYNSKPYFFYYTDKSKNNIRYKNSVVDYFARNCNMYFSQKRIEFLQNISIDKNIKEQEFKNKNMVIKTLKDASIDKHTPANVDYIVGHLYPRLEQYKNDRKYINYGVVNGALDKNESITQYELLDNKFKSFLNSKINYCLNPNKEGLTIYDFMFAIYKLGFKDDAILRLIPSLVVQGIKEISDTYETIVEGATEGAIRTFEFNNNIYSVVEKKLNVESINNTLECLILKKLNSDMYKKGLMFKLRVTLDTELVAGNKYKLVRDSEKSYLWSIYLNGELVTDNARVHQNNKEYLASNELELTIKDKSDKLKYREYTAI